MCEQSEIDSIENLKVNVVPLTGKKLATDAMTMSACCWVCRLVELLTHFTNDSMLIDSTKPK